MYTVKKFVSLFTDYFNKSPESNLYKLAQLFTDELQLLKETNDRIIEWRDIDQAQGPALDLIGQNVIQPRGQATDEVYRIMLKTKIARNLADGTLNGLIRAVAYVLRIDKSEITVYELWDLIGEPAGVAIETIPIEKIGAAGLTSSEFMEILRSFVAAGIKLVLAASGGKATFKLSLKTYEFDVPYRICNVLQTDNIGGKMASFVVPTYLKQYAFAANLPRCNTFSSVTVNAALSDQNVALAVESLNNDVLYVRPSEQTYPGEVEI